MAYVAGNPIMSDEEYDNLKTRLKVCAHFFLICMCLYVDKSYNGFSNLYSS